MVRRKKYRTGAVGLMAEEKAVKKTKKKKKEEEKR